MPYKSEFSATVLECRQEAAGYAVVLDQTLFHDGSGGQPPDGGTVGGQDVLDVYPGGVQTIHVLNAPVEPGRPVACAVDMARRLPFMQHHTAEHIFSGLVAARYGFSNVGFHIGTGASLYATLDFDGAWPVEDTPRLEYLVNQAVWKNVPVTQRLALPEDAYRSKKALDGDVRLVTVEGYDTCACCGSHVNFTGEIGAVKITGVKRYKGGLRVTILCGARALEDHAAKQETIRRLCSDLSSTEETLVGRVQELSSRAEGLGAELSRLRMRYFEQYIADIERSEPLTWLVWEEAARTDLPRMATALDGMVLLSRAEGGYYAALASKDGLAKELAAGLCDICGSKGGGSPTLWQGTLERLPNG